ncbi:MAG: amidase [Hyphomicrobium sp.]|uniref:amidase n=1 Tax=Hyphomicrobium sp. TaxID=82 RepID=UPI003D11F255
MDVGELELCYLSASEAIERFKARTLSPVDLMRAVIARAEQVNKKLNAITHSFFDRALDQARMAEAKYRKTDGRPRALEGIPVAIKDFHPVEGEITTFGSKIFEGFRPSFTAPTVQRLFDAGAIMHFRTTTPEFAYSGMTHSPLWGITRNPWNTDHTPGGSSGGSAAAVAAGMTTLADATDGGGSIRVPAAACGLVGFKPPFGRNPLDRDHPGESILSYGGLARTVADAALMQNVMSGPHPEDRCSLREVVRLPRTHQPLENCKIAFSMDLGYLNVDREVQENTRRALEVFRSLGCEVVEIDLAWTADNLRMWLTYWEGLFATVAAHFLDRWRNEMDPIVVDLLERGRRHSAADMYAVTLHRGKMWQVLGPVLEKFDFLVCPTNGVPAVRVDHDQASKTFEIDGKSTHATYGLFLTNPFNLMSECPVMSVPSGRASTGIPTGIQIVGRTYDDLGVFRAASAYEAANPWHDRHPDL